MKEDFFEITIKKIKNPKEDDLNRDLQWFSQSLGLIGTRDKEKSCFRIFIELVKAKKDGRMLSSDEIAEGSHLSRGTVIHHISHLAEKDMVRINRNRYGLSFTNFDLLVDNIERNFSRLIKDLDKRAKKIDKELGL